MANFVGNDTPATWTLANAGVADTVISHDGKTLYASTADGKINAYDLATHTLTASWTISATPGGTALGAIALSNDGKTLAVMQPGVSVSQVATLDIATGAISTHSHSGTSFADIAADGASGFLLTDSSNPPLLLDPAADTFTTVPLSAFYGGYSITSADGPLLLLTIGGISNGPVAVYDTRTGSLATGDDYQGSLASGFNFGIQAISAAAGQVAQFIYYSSINIYDLNAHGQRNIYLGRGPADGIAYAADGKSAYVSFIDGSIAQYDTATWSYIRTVGQGVATNWSNGNYGDNLLVSANGQWFTQISNGTLTLLDTTSQNETFKGTKGDDTFAGGFGNDTYVINSPGDTVTENPLGGIDTELASITTTLADNVENLRLTGKAAINGTGNALDNVLAENAAANVLDGGAGNDVLIGGNGDTLIGGTGNDTFIIGKANVTIVESTDASGGIDTLVSARSTVLAAGIENLTLTGNGAINGTGNSADNVITGNDGANRLDGKGGHDTLIGGKGNDTYIVHDTQTVIVEHVGEGTDTVRASVSYALPDNVEMLVLTGHGAINGTGNALDNTITGNDAANTLDGGGGADTLIGGKGNDTYVVTDSRVTIVELPGKGTDTVRASVSYALGANLENLILDGNAPLTATGNALDNVLTGNGAADTLIGGLGNDTYVVANSGTTIVENPGEGTDSVLASVSFVLGANLENLTLTGTQAIDGTGNTLANTITGNDAANTLDGGGGADTLIGGKGDDIYIVNNPGVTIVENPGEGTDTVRAAIDYALGANLENLTLTGGAALTGTGNALNNVLTGNSAADTLIGGAGNDTYVIANTATTIIESAGQGIDTVMASATYTLGANLENLVLTGHAAIDGTGNALVNVITGNDAANTLNGAGGADTLIGGRGDDTYVIDNSGVTIVENPGEGTDTVRASISTTLAANVENLVLTGHAAIDGTGNALANVITGNDAANTLDGGGGADTLIGGKGDDIYIVNNPGVTIVENPGEGTDTVQASISYTLAANVENLVLTGHGAINGTGNALANTLTGNDAANTLDGGGGADTLIGGKGDDVYLVNDTHAVVIEQAGEGNDRIVSTVSYTLSDNVEILQLAGSAAIDAHANNQGAWLIGNSAVNHLVGGSGDDLLTDVGNNDILTGGLGADIFQISATGTGSHAEITDFSVSDGDAISLLLLDADPRSATRNAFTFVGAHGFSGTVGELRYAVSGGNTYIYGDTNGDRAADFTIMVDGIHTFTAADFLL